MRLKAKLTLGLFLVAPSLWYCTKDSAPAEPNRPLGTNPLPANPQLTSGNAPAGYAFLTTGDFIGGGVPLDVFLALPGNTSTENLLQRSGDNASLPPGFNAFTAANGAKIAAGLTCFGCHAATVGDQFIPGLGNSLMDFTGNNTQLFTLLDFAVKARYPESSPEWQAYAPFSRGAKAAAPYTVLPFKGINPAFMLEQASVAHRNPTDLSWNGNPVFPIPSQVIGSDVPPLWNVKKKFALYYNGMGRGDFTKLLMQVSVVAVEDTLTARRINTGFRDVLAWLQQLQPPKYPQPTNSTLAATGKVIFEEQCADCHGTYGSNGRYPNLLVDLATVGTDPLYANYFLNNRDFTDWFNRSWYGRSPRTANAQPSAGYVAPPLDGVWATAPYLHNGSVPSLEALLDSSQRPAYWRRSFNSSDYDWEKIGWKFTAVAAPGDANTYNATLPGYGNQGHTYGDGLTSAEKKALLEYLKTL